MANAWEDILPPLDSTDHPIESDEQKSLEPVQTAIPMEQNDAEEPVFSYDGYQIVRGEYFAHINEPSLTLCDYKISVNNACLKKAADTTYIQVLVHPDALKLVIRPSSEDEKDSFCWHTAKHKPRAITCKGFYAMLVNRLGWNPDYRYKFLGKIVRSNGESLFVFDLTGPEIYQRQIVTDDTGKVKRKTKRTPIYQESWQNQFGIPVEEHRKAVQINIFDGYAVFGITDSEKTDPELLKKKEVADE